MKRLILGALTAASLLASPALAGDKKQNRIGPDGYAFTQKDFVMTKYTMTWVLVPDKAALDKIGESMGSPPTENDGDPLVDLVRVSRKAGYCIGYIVDPERLYEPAFIAHITMHCMYGRWHAPNDIGPRVK
jgi:hypothetical protein